jgi:DNA-binding transcriptional MerR regulator
VDKGPDAFRTISEVAQDLDLPQHVLRFWETRFAQIKPMKRGGGRRYYRREDIDLLRGIRHLLYGEGYTIRGVQRILKDEGIKFVQSVWRGDAPPPSRAAGDLEGEDALAALPENGPEPEEESGRGRGFFGILPSLLGGEIERPAAAAEHAGRIEPVLAEMDEPARTPPRPEPAANVADGPRPAPGSNGLTHDELHALRAALNELGECKRLLERALAGE